MAKKQSPLLLVIEDNEQMTSQNEIHTPLWNPAGGRGQSLPKYPLPSIL